MRKGEIQTRMLCTQLGCPMKNDDMVSFPGKLSSPDPDLSCLVESPNLLQASTRHPSLCLVEDPSG
jgi:hypothetical protein